MPTNQIARRLFATFACIALLSTAACREDREAHYDTCAEAQAQGAFSRGWLPDVLNPYASDIREFHNLDTNQGRASFRYADPLGDRMRQECSPVKSDEKLDGHTGESDETVGQLAKEGKDAFRCGHFTIVINTTKHLGILWH